MFPDASFEANAWMDMVSSRYNLHVWSVQDSESKNIKNIVEAVKGKIRGGSTSPSSPPPSSSGEVPATPLEEWTEPEQIIALFRSLKMKDEALFTRVAAVGLSGEDLLELNDEELMAPEPEGLAMHKLQVKKYRKWLEKRGGI